MGGVSYIADKAMARIYRTLAGQITEIGRHKDRESMSKEIAKYNAMVMGIHNYYQIATGVYLSLDTISLRILRKLYTKTKYKGFSKTCPNPAIQIPPKYTGNQANPIYRRLPGSTHRILQNQKCSAA